MPRSSAWSLWSAASAAGSLSARSLSEGDVNVALGDLACGSILSGRSEKFRARSVLVATADQLTSALALIELDGIARRLVLFPPDMPREHLPFVIASADVDVVISDRDMPEAGTAAVDSHTVRGAKIAPARVDRSACCQTEWVLLTSGTTGRPKMVVHTLASLAGAIDATATTENPVVWSTFYDIRRYGGLQIFLRALLTNAALVLPSALSSTADFLLRAAACKITHISGTPSHWRRALMSPAASRIAPRYVRLSGEIADQSILDHLRSFYPQAVVSHAFASTEAGVAFEVRDGLAGFPASFLGQRGGVEMSVEDNSLRIRSSRTAARYLGDEDGSIAGDDGFVDTGDMVERRGERYFFVGRRDGVINVGGLKIHPEEVEAVINRHPLVRMALVRMRKSPITGGLVVADVVLKTEPGACQPSGQLEGEIVEFCRQALPRHKVPAAIRFVSALALAATGKLVRRQCAAG
jgi:acyl-coenzyme A synthetase/AMP-(fatty) acid ligase